jgi:hypothetical protein
VIVCTLNKPSATCLQVQIPSDIRSWLASLGLEQYAAAFAAQSVDLDVLIDPATLIWRSSAYRSATAQAAGHRVDPRGRR